MSSKKIPRVTRVLKNKKTVRTDAVLWGIDHDSGLRELSLKLGRYKYMSGKNALDVEVPKSELTLDSDELNELITFLSEKYELFELGFEKYMNSSEGLSKILPKLIADSNKTQLIELLVNDEILPDEIHIGINQAKRVKAINEYELMLDSDSKESDWQKWFEKNSWILGSDFVEILDERRIDTCNIADYLMEAYDGFLDIIEIKRVTDDFPIWSKVLDHNNYVPSQQLIKAITQSIKYIYEIERESNSIKFHEKVGGVRVIKPRCILIYGRSVNWNKEQDEAFRILNASYHNLTILTYDQVLKRAKNILGLL